jgi:hypothetical protein
MHKNVDVRLLFITGAIYVYTVKRDTTILDLKHYIHQTHGYEIEKLRIVHEGKEVCDSETCWPFKEHKTRDGSTYHYHLVYRIHTKPPSTHDTENIPYAIPI